MNQADIEGWVDLCGEHEPPSEGGMYIEYDGRAYAVFRDGDGSIYVTDDACPHAGASLSASTLEDGCIVCTWHAWPFELKTGRCPDNPAIAVATYPAKIASGRIWCKLSGERTK